MRNGLRLNAVRNETSVILIIERVTCWMMRRQIAALCAVLVIRFNRAVRPNV